MAVQGRLVIHEIIQEKELWEGVSQIVYSSFKNVANTMHNIKRWTERTEFEQREAEKERKEFRNRLNEVERQVKNNSARQNFLLMYASALFGRMHKRTTSQKKYMKQQIDTSQAFYRNFCSFLGVEGMGENPYAAGIEPEQFRAELTGQAELTLDSAFGSWREKWERAEQDEMQTRSTLDELRELSERSREKLIAWRETLHSNAYLVESLSDSLLSTQNDLTHMRQSQVTPEQIEQIIGDTSDQIGVRVQEVAGGLDDLKGALSSDRKAWNQRLDSVGKEVDDRVDRHQTEVMAVLKKNINPMTAYLNSIHVKVDSARHRLGELDVKVPELQKGLGKAVEDLERKGDETSSRFKGMRKQLEDLLDRVDGHDGKFREERDFWQSSVLASAEDVGGRVGDLGESLAKLQEVVDSMEQERVVEVEQAVATLDSKVSKWVQARPLPAKISEARLFALESRLNEETDARHDLEARLEESSRSLELSTMLGPHGSLNTAFASKQSSHDAGGTMGAPWGPMGDKVGGGGPSPRASRRTQAGGQIPFDAGSWAGAGGGGSFGISTEDPYRPASPRFTGGYKRPTRKRSPRGSLVQAGAAAAQKGLKPVIGENKTVDKPPSA